MFIIQRFTYMKNNMKKIVSTKRTHPVRVLRYLRYLAKKYVLINNTFIPCVPSHKTILIITAALVCIFICLQI